MQTHANLLFKNYHTGGLQPEGGAAMAVEFHRAIST